MTSLSLLQLLNSWIVLALIIPLSRTEYSTHQFAVDINNEFEQFVKYESFTPVINASSNFLTEWTNCANRISQNFRNAKCTSDVRNRIREYLTSVQHPLMKPLRLANPEHKERFSPDCKYEVNFGTNESFSFNKFDFSISSAHCNSDTFLLPPGGSSFQITASNKYQQTTCSVRDNFDNTYAVMCPLRAWHNHHSFWARDDFKTNVLSSNYCIQLSVILDFEHYDAFSDTFGDQPPMNHQLVNEPELCYNSGTWPWIPMTHELPHLTSRLVEIQNLNSSRMGMLLNHLGSSWLRRVAVGEDSSHVLHSNANPSSHDLKAHAASSLSDYAWTGSGSTFLTMKEFHEYFDSKDQQVTRLVGESHMRYTWDFLYYLYNGADKLSGFNKKHGGSGHVPGLVHEGIFYATDVGDSVAALTCVAAGSAAEHTKQPKQTYVFQTGGWDLYSTSLRHYIRHPTATLHLIDAIHSLTRVKNCSKEHFRLIWVTSMPYPRCTELECENSRGFRNNYAIRAANQWIMKHLLDVPSEFVYVIDAEKIIAPRYTSEETACLNHFLCHPEGSVMKLTAAGMAVAGEVLHAASWGMPNHVDSVDCLSTSVMVTAGRDHTAALRARERMSHHHAPVHFLIANKSVAATVMDFSPTAAMKSAHAVSPSDVEYHMVQGNIRRVVPDAETYELIRTSIAPAAPTIVNNVFDSSSKAVNLQDYPCIVVPLPSRRAGNVMRGDYGKGVGCPPWVITGNGTRKPSESSNNCQEAFQMDINNIPLAEK